MNGHANATVIAGGWTSNGCGDAITRKHEKMSEFIGLVREISEVTKRQISVVHAMASFPELERMRFWHEPFMPLSAQEHALREELQVVGQGRTPDSSFQ